MRACLFQLGCWFVGLVFLTGCNAVIQGNWKTIEVIPGEAGKEFKIATAQFNSDGTYVAVSQYGDKKKMGKGSYSFNGFQLKLKTNEGKELTYGCMKVWDKLEVRRQHEGQTVKVIMAQQ